MNALSRAACDLACAGATVFCLAALPCGHGGTYTGGHYPGPGDTVPPGGGGGGGASTPGPAGPSTPAPGAPSTPRPTGPATPGPSGPATPGGGPGAPSAPSTGGGGGADLTAWTHWWEFNKEPYLNLKAAIQGAGATTGSDGWFLGGEDKESAKDSLRPSEEQIRAEVVPALLKALKNETNFDIVTGCMVALAKIGDEPDASGASKFEQAIKPHLKSKVQEIAETAAGASWPTTALWPRWRRCCATTPRDAPWWAAAR